MSQAALICNAVGADGLKSALATAARDPAVAAYIKRQKAVNPGAGTMLDLPVATLQAAINGIDGAANALLPDDLKPKNPLLLATMVVLTGGNPRTGMPLIQSATTPGTAIPDPVQAAWFAVTAAALEVVLAARGVQGPERGLLKIKRGGFAAWTNAIKRSPMAAGKAAPYAAAAAIAQLGWEAAGKGKLNLEPSIFFPSLFHLAA
jgi:hypothetical protein